MAIQVVCENRKAFHDYHIDETFEAGIVLTGQEVKSLRQGKANLKDSYARILGEEAFLINTHISHYTKADGFTEADPERTRKLLLHKHEIHKLMGKVREKGYTIIPTKLYFKGGKAKVQIALAKGKTFYDKREAIKKREAQKEVARAVKTRPRRERRGDDSE